MMMMSRIVVRVHLFILLICWVRNINILSVSIIDDSNNNKNNNNNNNNNSVSRNDATRLSSKLSDIDILSINDDKDYESSSRSSMNNNNSKKQHHNRVKAAKNNEILNLDKTTINILANRAIIKILEDHNDFDFDELDSSLKIELLNYIGQILSYSSEEINSYHDNRKIKSNSDYDDDINNAESSDITISINHGTEDYVRDIDDVNDDRRNDDSIVSSLIEDGKKDADAVFDNNSIWELLKQQIKSDFAPFLLLIPKPIKIFISNQFNSTYRSLKIITYSAVKPLLVVVNKYVLLFGMKLFHVKNQFNLLLNYISNIVNVEVDGDDGVDNSDKSVNKKKDKVVDDDRSIINVGHNEINSNNIDATTRDIIRVEGIDEEELYGELVEI